MGINQVAIDVSVEIAVAAEYLDHRDYPIKPLCRQDLLEWSRRIAELEQENRELKKGIYQEVVGHLSALIDAEKRRAVKAKSADDLTYCDACFCRAQGIESALKIVKGLALGA